VNLGVDVVIDRPASSRSERVLRSISDAGAKKVVISAPATDPDITLALGVNDDQYDPGTHHIISNSSCTNPMHRAMAKVLNDAFGIERGLMTDDSRLHGGISLSRTAARGSSPCPCRCVET